NPATATLRLAFTSINPPKLSKDPAPSRLAGYQSNRRAARRAPASGCSDSLRLHGLTPLSSPGKGAGRSNVPGVASLLSRDMPCRDHPKARSLDLGTGTRSDYSAHRTAGEASRGVSTTVVAVPIRLHCRPY